MSTTRPFSRTWNSAGGSGKTIEQMFKHAGGMADKSLNQMFKHSIGNKMISYHNAAGDDSSTSTTAVVATPVASTPCGCSSSMKGSNMKYLVVGSLVVIGISAIIIAAHSGAKTAAGA